MWDLVVGGVAASMDTAAAFYPWYAFLGATLRSGAIPVWNPHQFSGALFAADPESGWMYLPAMLLFSVFDLQLAAASYLVAHALLAGLSTYWLARTFGLGVPGSLLAGVGVRRLLVSSSATTCAASHTRALPPGCRRPSWAWSARPEAQAGTPAQCGGGLLVSA